MPSSISSSEGGGSGRARPGRTGTALASGLRLTAADRPGVAQPVPERDVPPRPWPRILLGALLVAVTLLGLWEGYWRSYGAVPGYRDDAALWARERRRVDAAAPGTTVLIGSSRSFFDVQLPVWQRLGGQRPIQLSLVGTSPLFALEDLAADEAFRGQLLVDVAPDLFFTGFENYGEFGPYWRKESPSQRVGKWLSMTFVEPWLAFYDPDFAFFTVLRRQAWPERPGAPERGGVRKLAVVGADRAAHMWAKVEGDPEYRKIARGIWAQRFAPRPAAAGAPDAAAKLVEKQIARAASAVARLRARGVYVLFVRHPTGGDYLAFERRAFPRATTWDPLLARTGAPGIHFEDYPQFQQGFEFPEWSHMSRESAERYTEALYRVIEREHPLPEGRRW
jgi:hypothetical protein